MSNKMKILFTSNIVFYILLFFHKNVVIKYGDDYILQVLFYIALSFSTIMLESTIRMRKNIISNILIVDLIIRLVALILHFIYLYFNSDIILINLFTSIFFVINIILESICYAKFKDINKEIIIEEKEYIKKTELNIFIENFYSNKLDKLSIGTNKYKELKFIMNMVSISGKENLVCIFMFIYLFVSSSIYKFNNESKFILLVGIIPLIILFNNISLKFNDTYYNMKGSKKKYFSSISFIIGYVILFISEVLLQEKIGDMRVTIWVIAIIFFIPTYNNKYKIKNSIENIYKEYKKCN
ncbi:MAG: hypothetical protein IJ086_08830 [Clostridium sp.]|nr:hypothetical protein [Clostridium sp.]